ncbi:lasso peptide biosynthesis B2 protein [Streptomyces corynorhini]|uniref:Lasso peptide biosynthesis B2 protein n=1 Tax=Streptomyces corynorhini TaxID=2282652 RepID=A0A370BB00_9ACTN|nr:lasso peptide biosynthesis B2 protein [Streptomyces corynorhini]RDG36876.1 lasso peptide biosynthesis B2 protein [Streptomyces corynorhini]
MGYTAPGRAVVKPFPRAVLALAPHACVIIDYDTGRTELRPVPVRPKDFDAAVVNIVGVQSWGTTDVQAILPPSLPVPARWRFAAVFAVLLTAAVRILGPRRSRFRRLVRLACCGRSLPPTKSNQPLYAVRAVRWASRAIPARWACLEESTAAAVLLAGAGRRAEWRHGVAVDPVRLHAWLVDRDGIPVEERGDIVMYAPTCTPDGPGSGHWRETETPRE